MAHLDFDANSVPPNAPFEVIPPGKYIVQISASEMRPTRDGGGQYLWLELDIIDGEYQGRKLWDRLNIVNNNTQAVEIAQRTLSAICHATGQLHVSDSEQLHFKPMVATVKVRPQRMENGKTFDASNEVRGYEPVDGGVPRPAAIVTGSRTVAGVKAAQAVAAKPAPANGPPWRQQKAS